MRFYEVLDTVLGFPSDSDGKQSAYNAGDLGSVPELGRSPGEGHGNPLQNSCLENPHGQRSLVGYSPWSCKELDTTEQLSTAQPIDNVGRVSSAQQRDSAMHIHVSILPPNFSPIQAAIILLSN